MDGAVNDDQNFWSRSPEYHQQQSHDEPYFEARSPQLPPKLPFLTTANLQAITSNGHVNGLNTNGVGSDPDDFYREYRGVKQSSSSHTDPANNDMAVAASEARHPPSSLRSNGNGSTPKHPSLPSARNNLKPSYRSASAPVDERILGNAKSTSALNGFGQARQPSVKDLLKRFDQNNEPSSVTARKPSTRINTRDNGNGTPGYMRERVGHHPRTAGFQDGAGAQRDAPARVKSPPVPRSTQRTRFAAEDQHSNNALSGAARSPRPRNTPAGNIPQASKSMTNLSPTSPNYPSNAPTRKPLFGEVLPVGQILPEVGYGIATRRTSDSSLHPSWSHHRSRSDVDVSPSSPTAWYLGVTPALDDVDPNKPRGFPAHNRNHSDFADSKVNTMNVVNPSGFKTPPISNAPLPPEQQPPKSQSRLPLASNRRSSPSDSSSPPSTRANSPFANKTLSNGKLRKSEQRPWSPADGAKTPTNATNGAQRSSRSKSRIPETLNMNNTSLKAYISAPLPKTSPPLRSSRPRQPVSTASTASTRQKATDRSGSPQQVRTGMKITRNNDPKPRKIVDVGPVDFAARRERIQRAYTKSIHESEQKEIRAANLRRLSERHAKSSVPAAEQREGRETPEVPAQSEPVSSPARSPEPLHISTSFQNHVAVPEDQSPSTLDSPTLGIPGSFVEDEDVPQSAISTATGVTDIDNEPQTEAPRLSLMPSSQRTVPRMISSHALPSYGMSVDEALFGFGQDSPDDAESIQIMLDATPVEEPLETTPTNDAFARDPLPPGAFKEDEDLTDQQPVFATTLTPAGTEETTTEQSRPVTPFEYRDENESCGDQSSKHEQSTNLDHFGFHEEEVTHSVDIYHRPIESANEVKSTLPTLTTTLASPLAVDDVVHEFLNTPVTEMDCESSDEMSGTPPAEHAKYEAYEPEQLSSRKFRSSQQSAWTDYSVETTNEDYLQQYSPLPIAPDAEKKPTPPPKEFSLSPKPGVPPKPENYSPQPSPRLGKGSPSLASPSHHQLPPLVTGEGFGVGFADTARANDLSLPLWPEHAPPPPPIPQNQGDVSPAAPTRTPPPLSFYNKRPPSSVFHGSQNGTSRNTESRRASDDVYSPRPSTSTPRSSTQISLEDVSSSQTNLNDVPLTEEEKKVAEKLRKRLFQRRMLIKELIDTESVYLKDMNVVEEIYKGTAEACPKLDANDVKAIFRNTDEIVAFSTTFLDELKSAAATVYSPRNHRKSKAVNTAAVTSLEREGRFSVAATLTEETDEQKDRRTFIGAIFGNNLTKMQTIYTDFLKNSELASTRLGALQSDGAVKVWLSECNLVAKDLTAAWDLDALLVKPVQRITRYQLLLAQIFEHTSDDHSDHAALQSSCRELASLLKNIDDLKRRIHMVGKIVGRKRKESDVRTGLAKAFGRRAEKLQASSANRPQDDEVYLKLHEKFGHDFLKLQIMLRDFEFYTRQIATYVADFLRYLSSIELMVRLSATPYPELESKWARFNMSMRDMGTVALEDHVNGVRKRVIEPIEQIIAAYGPPGLAMKKRSKRRLDYEKYLQIKSGGKKVDEKLSELVDQYEALNETLKMELPKLYAGSQKIGNICLVQFLGIQTEWYSIWQDKVRIVLEESQMPKDVTDIVDMFNRDYKYVEARAQELGICNGTLADDGTAARASSQSTMKDDDASTKSKSRPSNLSSRDRGFSTASDKSPSLPIPDFAKRHSGQFTFSPIVASTPGIGVAIPQFSYQTHSSTNGGHSRAGSASPATLDTSFSSRPLAVTHARPSTSRSYTSESGMGRISTDYNNQHRRESGSTYNSANYHVDGPLSSGRPYSGLFHSAMPLPDGPEESQRSSRASSRDRNVAGSFNVLYLAASLFEFNISATKSEAGYPYLTYQAGEIFDVIGEKGELWLAKNQDDPTDMVGWIWSKHFARLAND